MSRAAGSQERSRRPAIAEWRVDSIDFPEDGRCRFCNRPLPTGVAYVVISADGDRAAAGPKCAGRHAVFPEGGVVDFTRATPETPEKARAKTSIAASSGDVETGPGARRPPQGPVDARKVGRSSTTPKIADAELEYLRLRVEKLERFSARPNERLNGIHARTGGTDLAPEDRAYLANLVAKFERDGSLLAPANLQTCYAYGVWLERFLEEEPHGYVAGMLSELRYKLTLTPNQLQGINRFFANRRGFPELDPRAFSDYGS